MQIRFAGFTSFDGLNPTQKLKAMEIAEKQHQLLEQSSGVEIPLKVDSFENYDKSHRVVVETSGSLATKLDRNIQVALSKKKIMWTAYRPGKIDCSGTNPSTSSTATTNRTQAKAKKAATPVVELDRPQLPPPPKNTHDSSNFFRIMEEMDDPEAQRRHLAKQMQAHGMTPWDLK